MWFKKIMIRFFIGLDTILFNFIGTLYDLLISISRTSILTQGEIQSFATRVEVLLGIFMLFKLSFSLITYIINPDNFSDSSKGFGKLIQNSVLSLAMLILVPYAFQMAFNLQAKILDDNLLAKLILGEKIMSNDDSNTTIIDTAGERMAFEVMLPFFTPNYAISDLSVCLNLYSDSGNEFNPECYDALSSVMSTADSDDATSSSVFIDNYTKGIQLKSLGLTFRESTALMSVKVDDESDEYFVIDYKYLLSTVVAIIVCLLLVTFCIDIGVRSVKLAFLQLIYPIPVISFMDPASGKDGFFKKWYKMCFSTFLSLFLRLAALYFGIYVIVQVGDLGMYDIINGSQVTNFWVQIFIIIGILIFIKQMPKILESLGIKLDGDGFSLNPLKKLQDNALGGKQLINGGKRIGKGAAGVGMGLGMGIAGAATGAGIGRAFTGAFKGMKDGLSNKKLGEIHKGQIDANQRMREAKTNGSTFFGRRKAQISEAFGAGGGLAKIAKQKSDIETQNKIYDDQIKSIEDAIAPNKRQIADQKRFSDAIKSMEARAKDEIKQGNGGAVGTEYLKRKAELERLKSSGTASVDELVAAESKMNSWLNDEGMKKYMSQAIDGTIDDKTFENLRKNAVQAGETIGVELSSDGGEIHGQFGRSKGTIGELERGIYDKEQEIEQIKLDKAKLGDELREIAKKESVLKANKDALGK